jgi:hypothetical protein
VPTSKPQPDGTLVKALARAWRWQRMLDEGFYGSITQVAEAESLNPSYVSRILRLTLLAPQIVEVILGGHQPSGIQLQAMLDRLPASWATQMALFAGDAERSLGTGPSRNGTLWSRAGRELRNEAGQGMTKHRVSCSARRASMLSRHRCSALDGA